MQCWHPLFLFPNGKPFDAISQSHIAILFAHVHVSNPFLRCDIAIASEAISLSQAIVNRQSIASLIIALLQSSFFRNFHALPQNHYFTTFLSFTAKPCFYRKHRFLPQFIYSSLYRIFANRNHIYAKVHDPLPSADTI